MKKINSLNIEYFFKVAETLNFSKAANELSISQPALSKQIKKLESELEISLFKRSTKQVELTTAGELLYKEYKELLSGFESVMEKAKQQQDFERKTFHIGILEFPNTVKYVQCLLNEFQKIHPELDLIIKACGFSELKQNLENNTFDIVFSIQQEVELKTEWIQQFKMYPLHLGIVVPPNNHLYNRMNLRVSDLSEETFYIFSNTYSDIAKKNVKKQCANVGFCPMSYAEFPDLTTLGEALIKEGGITIGYKEFFEPYKKFKFFPIVEDEKSNFFVAAYKKGEIEKLKPFLSYLEKYV